jgi:hypothetical protein
MPSHPLEYGSSTSWLSLALVLFCHLGLHLSLGSSCSAPSTLSFLASPHLAVWLVYPGDLPALIYTACHSLAASFVPALGLVQANLIFIQIVACPSLGHSASFLAHHVLANSIINSHSLAMCLLTQSLIAIHLLALAWISLLEYLRSNLHDAPHVRPLFGECAICLHGMCLNFHAATSSSRACRPALAFITKSEKIISSLRLLVSSCCCPPDAVPELRTSCPSCNSCGLLPRHCRSFLLSIFIHSTHRSPLSIRFLTFRLHINVFCSLYMELSTLFN